MKNGVNEFILIKKVKEFIIVVESDIAYFPKKELVIKDLILKDVFYVLEFIYNINYSYSDRINDLYKLLSKLKMIDYYLFLSKEKGCLSYKRFLYLSRLLRDIIKISYGWLRSEKDKNKL